MKIGKKTEAMSKRLIEYLVEQIQEDENSFSAWDRALEIMESLRFNRKVRAISLTRGIPLGEKLALFRDVMEKAGLSLSSEAFNIFQGALIQEDLWNAIPYIRTGMRKGFFARTRQVEISVCAANAVDTGEKRRIENALSVSFGNRKIRADWNTDQTLIAGLVIQAGTHVWDGSLKGRLNRMKQELLERA
uniref:ATP synthase subunit delta n=1 Tax=Leptospirillum ferriphilum TaxID=178606 RepID=K4ER18_9BACT|nr:ATP synthase F1 delta subunit [Leptospirillum ferriphilum]